MNVSRSPGAVGLTGQQALEALASRCRLASTATRTPPLALSTEAVPGITVLTGRGDVEVGQVVRDGLVVGGGYPAAMSNAMWDALAVTPSLKYAAARPSWMTSPRSNR